MTYPRSHLVDPDEPGFYHLTSRCVRRARLCGYDSISGKSFEHRRAWIEKRIHYLSRIFCVSVYAYAVMNNHYHIVLKLDPPAAKELTDNEVAERWLKLKSNLKKTTTENYRLQMNIILADRKKLSIYRSRLGCLSWFMKLLNEPIARRANKEDECKGHFWESRFHSQALLDEAAIISCMVYVDLNPARAGIVKVPEKSKYTSIYMRSKNYSSEPDSKLLPVISGAISSHQLPLSLTAYIDLVNYTFLSTINDLETKTKKEYVFLAHNLNLISLDSEKWIKIYNKHRYRQVRALGFYHHLLEYAKKIGQRWVRHQNKFNDILPVSKLVHELP